MLNVSQRKPHNTPRAHSPAVWLTLTAIGIVSLGAVLIHSDLAQAAQSDATQAAAARAIARRGMSEDQVVAMHAVLKRPRLTAPTEVDRTAMAD
jgi:hypothetical protein